LAQSNHFGSRKPSLGRNQELRLVIQIPYLHKSIASFGNSDSKLAEIDSFVWRFRFQIGRNRELRLDILIPDLAEIESFVWILKLAKNVNPRSTCRCNNASAMLAP